jgi:hypothetical protein
MQQALLQPRPPALRHPQLLILLLEQAKHTARHQPLQKRTPMLNRSPIKP